MAARDLTPDKLAELFRYTPETGELLYMERDVSLFRDDAQNTAAERCRAWNTKWAGKEFGSYNKGYKTGKVLGISMSAHRIAWILVHGSIPSGMEVDHINGVRDDNRTTNLQLTNRVGQMRNRSLLRNNSSGHVGVSYVSKRNKYIALIGDNGKQRIIGFFPTAEEAASAYRTAAKELGYSPRHGANPPPQGGRHV